MVASSEVNKQVGNAANAMASPLLNTCFQVPKRTSKGKLDRTGLQLPIHVAQVLSKASMVYEFPSPMMGDDRKMLTESLAFAKDMVAHRRYR